MVQIVHFKKLIGSLFLPLSAGLIASILSGGGSGIRQVYESLPKPPFSPPGIVFPIVWTILYLLMGISAYLAKNSVSDTTAFHRVYYVQLLLNILWPVIFFRLQWFGLALVDLGILILLIAVMLLILRRLSVKAMLLQLPYLLWCIYAAYLNYGILSLV